MISANTTSLLRGLLYSEFYEMYGFYMRDVEFGKKCPELWNAETNKHYKDDCNEIVTALSEVCNISFEEAEKHLIGYYTRKTIRQQQKEA